MYQPVLNSASFEKRAKDGLAVYKSSKKRITSLTLGLPWNSSVDIKNAFRELNRRVNRIAPTAKIDYIGVIVRQLKTESGDIRYHAHILWKKPFIPYEKLVSIWSSILHRDLDEHLVCNSVTNTPASVERLVFYYNNQSEEHFPCTVSYIQSDNWGIMPKSKKREKNAYDSKAWMKKVKRRARQAELRDDI